MSYLNYILYPVRLRADQIVRLEEEARDNPVAPLVRKIIDNYFGVDITNSHEFIEYLEEMCKKSKEEYEKLKFELQELSKHK